MRLALSCVFTVLLSARLFADGNFSDNFEQGDGPPGGWVNTLGTIPVTVELGEMILGTDGTLEGWVWIDTKAFERDFTLQFDITFEPSGSLPEIGRHGGVMFCASEKTNRYSPTMNGYVMDWIDRVANPPDHGYRFHKWMQGTPVATEIPLIPDGSFFDTPDPGKTWRITTKGPTLTFEVDDEIKGQVDDADYRGRYIGFWGWSNLQRIHIDNVTVTQPLTVTATATPLTGVAPLEVQFDASGSTTPVGTITGHDWDFGDGMTASGATLKHTYSNTGVYTARITVTNSDGSSATCTLDTPISALCPSGDITPWRSSNVGDPVFPGSARFLDATCMSICAGGKGITGLTDSFHFIHQEVPGDNTLTTQIKEVISWQTASPQSIAGIMFRNSLDPNSPFVLMAARPVTTGIPPTTSVKTILLFRKSSTSSVLTRVAGAKDINPPGSYLQLERKGADFIGSWSATGEPGSFMEFSRATLDAPEPAMLAGPAVVASDRNDEGLSASLVFCGTSFLPTELDPGVPQNLAATPGDGEISLSWDAPAAGGSFTGYGIWRGGVKLVDVGVAPTTYIDGGLTNGTRYCYKVRATRGAIESADSLEACETPAGEVLGQFHRGDSDGNGQLQLTDAVRILNVLFLGTGAIPCDDAADADDNGQLQLTDAVRILNVLFLGTGAIPLPGPPADPCGVDPTDDALACASYTCQ